jgi:hypothetical protein
LPTHRCQALVTCIAARKNALSTWGVALVRSVLIGRGTAAAAAAAQPSSSAAPPPAAPSHAAEPAPLAPEAVLDDALAVVVERCVEIQRGKGTAASTSLRSAAIALLEDYYPDKVLCCTICDCSFTESMPTPVSVQTFATEHFTKAKCDHSCVPALCHVVSCRRFLGH